MSSPAGLAARPPADGRGGVRVGQVLAARRRSRAAVDRQRRRNTVDDNYSPGGVESAVRASAESVNQALDQAGRANCRALFLRLVDVRAARPVRRHAPLAELSEDLLVVATPFRQRRPPHRGR